MPKSFPRRNAAEGRKRRFLKGITGNERLPREAGWRLDRLAENPSPSGAVP